MPASRIATPGPSVFQGAGETPESAIRVVASDDEYSGSDQADEDDPYDPTLDAIFNISLGDSDEEMMDADRVSPARTLPPQRASTQQAPTVAGPSTATATPPSNNAAAAGTQAAFNFPPPRQRVPYVLQPADVEPLPGLEVDVPDVFDGAGLRDAGHFDQWLDATASRTIMQPAHSRYINGFEAATYNALTAHVQRDAQNYLAIRRLLTRTVALIQECDSLEQLACVLVTHPMFRVAAKSQGLILNIPEFITDRAAPPSLQIDPDAAFSAVAEQDRRAASSSGAGAHTSAHRQTEASTGVAGPSAAELSGHNRRSVAGISPGTASAPAPGSSGQTFPTAGAQRQTVPGTSRQTTSAAGVSRQTVPTSGASRRTTSAAGAARAVSNSKKPSAPYVNARGGPVKFIPDPLVVEESLVPDGGPSIWAAARPPKARQTAARVPPPPPARPGPSSSHARPSGSGQSGNRRPRPRSPPDSDDDIIDLTQPKTKKRKLGGRR